MTNNEKKGGTSCNNTLTAVNDLDIDTIAHLYAANISKNDTTLFFGLVKDNVDNDVALLSLSDLHIYCIDISSLINYKNSLRSDQNGYFNLLPVLNGAPGYVAYRPEMLDPSTAALFTIYKRSGGSTAEMSTYELVAEYKNISDIPSYFWDNNISLQPIWTKYFTESNKMLSNIYTLFGELV